MTTLHPSPRTVFDPANANARPLSLRICRDTFHDWEQAKERRRKAYRDYEASRDDRDSANIDEAREWERWLGVLTVFEHDAMRRAIACVLLMNRMIDDASDIDELGPNWKPCAFHDGEFHYVVFPLDPDATISPPRLVVVHLDQFASSDFGRGPGTDD